MKLRYGLNPQQTEASAEPAIAGAGPITVLNGAPSYINLLDILNAWQLVQEASSATGMVAAASFKHVSPAGAALGLSLTEQLAEAYEVANLELSETALAYVRARGADPKSSYGDVAAVSAAVEASLANYLAATVSDGIVAPDYTGPALDILKKKRGGKYLIVQADPGFEPPAVESREVFGLRLIQQRDGVPISARDLEHVVAGKLPDSAHRDLLLALAAVRYTQSNSVGYALGGQMIGIGAGQQSRVDCTKLAGAKARTWWLLQHPRVRQLSFRPEVKRQDRINWRVRYVEGDLTASEQFELESTLLTPLSTFTEQERTEWLAELKDVSLASDGFIPFPDNVEQAHRYGTRYIAAPAGGVRGAAVEETCRRLGITLVHTPRRFFHH
ncbi:MAG: phosphoribosylaminoimidazolecarboxamide formyltransferase [Chloroflexota bacterium]|nr:phosphoribosylaminoimidazolecarboxamide formyltransferase [Chloroflexota bacterium]